MKLLLPFGTSRAHAEPVKACDVHAHVIMVNVNININVPLPMLFAAAPLA